jgi:hypothetical protein
LGRPVEAPRQVDGVRWLDLPREARDSFFELVAGDLTPTDCLAGLRHVRVDAVYALDDPAPPARELVVGAWRQIGREVVKISRRSR